MWNGETYAVEFYMVCTRGDYSDGPVEPEVSISSGDGYTTYTATVVYENEEYTESKTVYDTTKPLAVGQTYLIGDTIAMEGTVYFPDDCEGARRTSMSGYTPIVDVGFEEEMQQTSYDAIILDNYQFVRMDDEMGSAAGEMPEWLFTPNDSTLVGVKIVSGSGTDSDPYVLAPVYGISVTYEANDGIFNTVEGYSVTQYYAQASGGVHVNPIAENPESSGKLFIGWFTDEYGEEKFDFSTPITGSITLYAGWVSI